MTDLDFTGMDIAEREAIRVGDLTAPLRDPDYVPDPAYPGFRDDGSWEGYRASIPTGDLLKLAEIGKWMLYEAIYVADDQNNDEAFAELFSLYGPLVSAAMQEMSLRDRSTLTGSVEDPLVKCSGCGNDQYLHRTTCPVCHRSAPEHCL